MKAASYRRYGGPEVVDVIDVPDPIPGPHDLVVRMGATSVGVSDQAARSGRPAFGRLYFGLRRPRFPVLGWQFVGVVDRVGDAVTRFRVGQRVFGTAASTAGGHAELILVREDAAVLAAPDGLADDELVAVIDGVLTALPFYRDGAKLRAGQRVLINGATGVVGVAAVQLAKHFGAQVTAVCRTESLDLARSLGADEVIDFTREDFTRSGRHFDVVFDVAAASTFRRSRDSLTPTGVYLTTVPTIAILAQQLWTSRSRGRRAAILLTGLRGTAAQAADLGYLSELVSAGRIVPVIDSRHTLDHIADAYRRLAEHGKRGVVVVTAAAFAGSAPHELGLLASEERTDADRGILARGQANELRL
jgi:NADPH:quinone reductase-like Zn-dependent oxidoreductase